MVAKFADHRNPDSLAARLRRKRNQWFTEALQSLPRPLHILDVGGTQAVWERIGFVDQPDIRITLINIEHEPTNFPNVESIRGDARNMNQFGDRSFDIVYSNSVIEHVGPFDDMRRMAQEIQRVSRRYFVQTPYRYFPIEPHFVFPLFQFMPYAWRIHLLQRHDLGWIERMPDRAEAEREVRSVNLLSKTQMRSLFPDGNFRTEKLFGLTKSLIAFKF